MFQNSVNSAKHYEKISRLLLFICSSLVLSLNPLWKKTLAITYNLQLPFLFQSQCCFDNLIYLRGYQLTLPADQEYDLDKQHIIFIL